MGEIVECPCRVCCKTEQAAQIEAERRGKTAVQIPFAITADDGIDGQRQRFTSRILPPYMRRSPKVAEVLPILYLRGLSTGDFREALPVLLGDDAAGLSATNIARLTAVWDEDYRRFRQRDLAERDYVYVWVDMFR